MNNYSFILPQAEAQTLEHTLAQKSTVGSGVRNREKALLRAADLHLKLGNIKRHCEILIELGEWEKAICLAPGVSMQYWNELSKRCVHYDVRASHYLTFVHLCFI